MKIFCWNCQGDASRGFRSALLQFYKDAKPDIVSLLEPRISGDMANKVCQSLGFDNWIRVEAVGFSGGIWVLSKNNMHMDIITTNPQFVLAKVKQGMHGWFFISFVYGSPTHNLRNKLWEGLRQDRWGIDRAWISVGDYNVVMNIEDVSNSNTFGNRR